MTLKATLKRRNGTRRLNLKSFYCLLEFRIKKNIFYETTKIEDLLKCQKVLHPFDEYHSPRLLPCCGKTICHNCVQSIQKALKFNKFKCILCQKESSMPDGGFLVNELAEQLISKQTKELYRGAEAESLKQSPNELDSSKAKLTFELENGETIIDEECRDLKTAVQSAKEKRIE